MLTMDLFKFRGVFHDIYECRTMIIRCLAGSYLIALRQAIGFWLSNKEKEGISKLSLRRVRALETDREHRRHHYDGARS